MKESGALQGGEVLAVDPEQVNGTVIVPSRSALCANSRHGLGNVGDLDVPQLNVVVFTQPVSGPFEIAIDREIATPGVEVNSLSPGFGDNGWPVILFCRCAACGQQDSREAAGYKLVSMSS